VQTKSTNCDLKGKKKREQAETESSKQGHDSPKIKKKVIESGHRGGVPHSIQRQRGEIKKQYISSCFWGRGMGGPWERDHMSRSPASKEVIGPGREKKTLGRVSFKINDSRAPLTWNRMSIETKGKEL